MCAMVLLLATACTPFPLTRRIAAAHPECLFYVNTSAKQIALTIDDGPDRRTTPQILNLLRKHDAHATFFMISDRVTGNDSLLRQTLREGHEIGNHMTRNEASVSLAPRSSSCTMEATRGGTQSRFSRAFFPSCDGEATV